MNIFDTHAHYTDGRFENETDGGADALLREIFANGVCGIINQSVNTQNAARVIGMTRKYPLMYAAVGIHPTEMSGELPLDDAIDVLRGMIADKEKNGIVAIGEIGLDYHYDDTDREKQMSFFRAQLELAEQTGLPVCVHDRDAHGDTFETLIKYPSVRGVLHSFSGSAEMAHELIRRGWYISFSGVVTFRNAPRVREAAASVPADRLLLETDAPYLAPEPFRGRINRSDYIRYSAQVLGELHGMSADELCNIAKDNALKLFNI